MLTLHTLLIHVLWLIKVKAQLLLFDQIQMKWKNNFRSSQRDIITHPPNESSQPALNGSGPSQCELDEVMCSSVTGLIIVFGF